jgi:hypothetical protein
MKEGEGRTLSAVNVPVPHAQRELDPIDERAVDGAARPAAFGPGGAGAVGEHGKQRAIVEPAGRDGRVDVRHGGAGRLARGLDG